MHSYKILHRLVTLDTSFETMNVNLWFIFSIYFDFNFSSKFLEISTLSLPATHYVEQNTNLPSNSNMMVVKTASTERFLKRLFHKFSGYWSFKNQNFEIFRDWKFSTKSQQVKSHSKTSKLLRQPLFMQFQQKLNFFWFFTENLTLSLCVTLCAGQWVIVPIFLRTSIITKRW